MSILQPMTRPSTAQRLHRFRVRASLLLAVFLSAGTSLPSIDALAYHQGAEGERSQPHIEPAGGCLSHAGHCSLGRTAPGSGAALYVATTIQAETDNRAAAPRLSSQLRFNTHQSGSPQPRAPPAPLA